MRTASNQPTGRFSSLVPCLSRIPRLSPPSQLLPGRNAFRLCSCARAGLKPTHRVAKPIPSPMAPPKSPAQANRPRGIPSSEPQSLRSRPTTAPAQELLGILMHQRCRPVRGRAVGNNSPKTRHLRQLHAQRVAHRFCTDRKGQRVRTRNLHMKIPC